MSWLGNWLERRQSLREMQRLQREQALFDEFELEHRLEEAKNALIRDDLRTARAIWTEVKSRYAVQLHSAKLLLDVLLPLQLYDEADRLMQDGIRKHPREARYVEGYARVAETRRDWQEAVRRWELMRKKFPLQPAGFISGGVCVAALGNTAEAEKLLNRAVQMAPGNLIARIEHARLASLQEDWPTALKRWTLVKEKFFHLQGYVGIANTLRRMGRFDAAAAVLEEARLTNASESQLFVEQAFLALERGDMEVYFSIWQEVRARFPNRPVGYIEGAKALLEANRLDEAATILEEAVDRFIDSSEALSFLMLVYERREDWPAMAAVAQKLRTQFASNPEGYVGGAKALAALGDSAGAKQLQEDWAARARSLSP